MLWFPCISPTLAFRLRSLRALKCKLGYRESELVSFIVMSSPVPASGHFEGHDAQRDKPGDFQWQSGRWPRSAIRSRGFGSGQTWVWILILWLISCVVLHGFYISNSLPFCQVELIIQPLNKVFCRLSSLSTADPWTMWDLEASTPCTVKIPSITFDFSHNLTTNSLLDYRWIIDDWKPYW